MNILPVEQLSLFNPIDNKPYVVPVEDAIAPPTPPAPPPVSTTVEPPTLEPGQRVRVADDALIFSGKLGTVKDCNGLGVSIEVDGYTGPPHPRFAPEQLEPVEAGVVKEWRWWPDQQIWHYTGHMGLAESAVCLHPNSKLFPVGVDPNEAGVLCPS